MSKIVKFREFLAANDAENPILLEQTSEMFMPSFVDYYDYRINEEGTGLWGGLKNIGRKIKNWWTGKSDEPAKQTAQGKNSQEVQQAKQTLDQLQGQYNELMNPDKVIQELSNTIISVVPSQVQNKVKNSLAPKSQFPSIKAFYEEIKNVITNPQNANPYKSFVSYANKALTTPPLSVELQQQFGIDPVNLKNSFNKYLLNMNAQINQISNAMQQTQQIIKQKEETGTGMSLQADLKGLLKFENNPQKQLELINKYIPQVTENMQVAKAALNSIGLKVDAIFNQQNQLALQWIALKTAMQTDAAKKPEAAQMHVKKYINQLFEGKPESLPKGVNLAQYYIDNARTFAAKRTEILDEIKNNNILDSRILDKITFDPSNNNDQSVFPILKNDPNLKDLAERYENDYNNIVSLLNYTTVLLFNNNQNALKNKKNEIIAFGKKLAKPIQTP